MFSVDDIGFLIRVEALVNDAAPQSCVAVGAFGHLESAVDPLAVMPVGPVGQYDRFEWGEVTSKGGDAYGSFVGDEAHG